MSIILDRRLQGGREVKKAPERIDERIKTGTGQMGQRFQPHILGQWAVRLEAGALLKVKARAGLHWTTLAQPPAGVFGTLL